MKVFLVLFFMTSGILATTVEQKTLPVVGESPVEVVQETPKDVSSDASVIKKWVTRVKNVPTFVLLGFNLGYAF